MRKGKSKDAKRTSNAETQRGPSPTDALGRAEGLLERLRTDGPKPVTAAEELDRQQGALARDGSLEDIRERVQDLCEAWTARPLRGDIGRAWLTMVGGFRLTDLADQVALIAANPGNATLMRVQSCQVLAQLSADDAAEVLLAVVAATGDVQVRTAAAEALGEVGDPSVRPALKALLEEDLPRPLWSAISATVDRVH